MKSQLGLAALSALLAGCVRDWSVRTDYSARIEADAEQNGTMECGLEAKPYGKTVGYRKTNGSFEKWTEDHSLPLRLILTNHSANIVTVDWDHSAIVLDKLSYSVALFEQPKNSRDVEAIKKPPVPVLAPNSSIEVFVLPEETRPSANRFSEAGREAVPTTSFLPLSTNDVARIRVVLALTGWSAPYVDCGFRARLVNSQVSRSTGDPWPAEGETCVPELGCAEGFRCMEDRCVSQSRPPPPRARFGQACFVESDCESGLSCQSSMCLKK